MCDNIPTTCMMDSCKKKLKFFHYQCRCKQYYCLKHRASEVHACTYDYKKNLNKEKLIDEMKCVSKQIDVI